ncbi:hypothetical protein ACS0TY_025169 [Phlomoides rotata]
MQQFASKETPLVIECFDFNNSGNHVLIGKLQKSVEKLQALHRSIAGANLISPPSGWWNHEKAMQSKIFVDSFVEKQLYIFLDYISSGLN